MSQSEEETKEPAASIVRQVRLRPEVFEKLKARVKELHMPVATYIAMAVERSLGKPEGLDSLYGDMKQLRDLQEAVRGGGTAGR